VRGGRAIHTNQQPNTWEKWTNTSAQQTLLPQRDHYLPIAAGEAMDHFF
jgi:hypothetical protein